jgi:hypothetical protein
MLYALMARLIAALTMLHGRATDGAAWYLYNSGGHMYAD